MLFRSMDVSRELIAKEVFKENYNANSQYGFHTKNKKTEAIPKVSSDKKRYLERQLVTFYIHKFDTLSDQHKAMIAGFTYTDALQEIIDYVISYYNTHTEFSMQHIIENADLSISTGLLDIIQSQLDNVSDIDIDFIINNLLLLNLDDEIESLNLQLKDSDEQANLQQLIQKRRIEKQALTMKMRNHKLKN